MQAKLQYDGSNRHSPKQYKSIPNSTMKHPNTISHTISHPSHRRSSLQKSNNLNPIPSSNLSHRSNPDEKVLPPTHTSTTTTLKPHPPLPLHILPHRPSRSPIHRALTPNPPPFKNPTTTATKSHSSFPPPPPSNPSSSSAPLPHNPHRLINTSPPPPPPLHGPHRENTNAKRFRSMLGRMYAHLHT